MKRITAVLLLVLAALVMTVPVFGAGKSQEEPQAKSNERNLSNDVYIVQLSGEPVLTYTGGIAGFPATKPGQNKKIDPRSSKVVKYVGFLTNKQSAVAAAAGTDKIYSYVYTFNGFAAEMTEGEAEALRHTPGVLEVTKDEMWTADTSSTPAFLGLTDPGSLWYQLGYPSLANKKTAGPGEDVIIGIIDSGIWPEHPSFSDRDAAGKLAYQQVPGWNGKCTPGEQFTASLCNQKLIGGQYYNAAWGGNAGIDAQRPWEFNSVRDYNGHGTHTASTSGGNYGVPATGPAALFGSISGMAPRARISAYKALWSTESGDTASGFTADLVAAIDQAVADGVDVINYSISGSTTSFVNPVSLAFFNAAASGVFVAASAGNSGPTTGTVAHAGPWITTVAAGTHNRDGQGSVTLGNSVTYNGASVATPVGPVPLIDSVNAGLSGATPTLLALCYGAADGEVTLDPALVAGKIIVCERGGNARVNKSLAVQQAGGVGMILLNPSANSINADFHFVPTVHLQNTDYAAVKAYAATPGATATINASTIIYTAPAPFTASFSSRGPLAATGDLLKPDLIAPGQDILAGVAPPTAQGRLFNLLSGTSMSSPHVAGLAAALIDLHPDWSVMAIKSALMTTGSDVLDGPNTNPLVIFRQGAGHVRPNLAADPGLIFDSDPTDWFGFVCGTGQFVGGDCNTFTIDPSDLNVASIAIGDLPGSQTVTRTVTNVGPAGTYNIAFSGLTGVTATASPSSFTIPAGGTQNIQFTFTVSTATLNSYVGGQITFSGPRTVRIPAVVRPVAFSAPAEISGTGASGSTSFGIKFGYTGTFSNNVSGLIPASTFAGTVTDDPGDSFAPGGPGTTSFVVAVPAGTIRARFALYDGDTDGADDLDLYVYNAAATLVGASGGGTSDETVTLVTPTAGNYTVWVHGFGTDGPDSNFTLFTWALTSADAGNATVSGPASATIGTGGTVNYNWSGLGAARYLGTVNHVTALGTARTIVSIDAR